MELRCSTLCGQDIHCNSYGGHVPGSDVSQVNDSVPVNEHSIAMDGQTPVRELFKATKKVKGFNVLGCSGDSFTIPLSLLAIR